MNSLVSVIIPAYNAAGTIRAAAESVLAQNFTDYEMLIIDDASADDIPGALKGMEEDSRLRILRHERNRGAAAARNTGIKQAKGKYVAFLDADDIWLPGKLEAQLDYMSLCPDRLVRASCTSFLLRRLSGRKYRYMLPQGKSWNEALLGGCGVSPGSTLMAERSLFHPQDIGLFAENLKRLEDWDWLLAYIRSYRLGIVESVLAEVRLSGYPAYETVRASADRLDRKQAENINRHFGSRKLRQFKAGLEIEKGGAAFQNRMYVTAVAHLARSALASPSRFWSLILRLFNKNFFWKNFKFHQ